MSWKTSGRKCPDLTIEHSNVTSVKGVYNDTMEVLTAYCDYGYYLVGNISDYVALCDSTGNWDPVVHCTGKKPPLITCI
jgi:hypothetical protein